MSLESQIAARLRLAEHPPERDWHLYYVALLRAELRELQAQLDVTEQS
jgi:hypothetical protein